MIEISLPHGATKIINLLTKRGFDAYVVGGCVRDSLYNIPPKDWDICTNAKPEEMLRCFNGFKVIETGLKHGTITIVLDDGAYEVTTFRTDGTYSDNRHPDEVLFTNDLYKDLERRDFTINAMAYNPTVGLVDPFGGLTDLADRRIACVGHADDRFNEDALRIMRALRFSSCYGFDIEKSTEESIHKNVGLLNNIAVERITQELIKLLGGMDVLPVLLNYSDVITTIIPELSPCVGFDQNNKYHQYTVYDHIAHAIDHYVFRGDDIVVKMALLLHDIGKPFCYSEDERGGHTYEHNIMSHKIARQVVERLRFDRRTQNEIVELVLCHDDKIEPTPKAIKRLLNRLGEKQLYRLLHMRFCDCMAHTAGTQNEFIRKCTESFDILTCIIDEAQCFNLKHLAINGTDLINAGIPEGRQIGRILNKLLDLVIDGTIQNQREPLLELALNERTAV